MYCTYLVEKYIQELLPKTVTYVFGNLVFFLWEVRETDRFADKRGPCLPCSAGYTPMRARIFLASCPPESVRYPPPCPIFKTCAGRPQSAWNTCRRVAGRNLSSSRTSWNRIRNAGRQKVPFRSFPPRCAPAIPGCAAPFDQLARGLQGNPAEYILTSYLLPRLQRLLPAS